MGITTNIDVKDAFRIITEDGNRIFLDDNSKKDVKLREGEENDTWDLISIDNKTLIADMNISCYAVSNKILTFTYRLKGETKAERKNMKLWF